MGGGIAQLAAFGAADQFLSAMPSITWFKQVWRRYTQFAMESIEQSWTGDAGFGKKCTVSLSRSGDLVTEIWLQIQLPDLQDFNHITGATRSDVKPVIFKANYASEATTVVRAHPCTTLNGKYVLSLKSDSSTVSAVSVNTVNGATIALTFPSAVGQAVNLVPLDGTGTIATTGSEGNTVFTAASGLVAGTTYAVCFGTDTSSKAHLVRLQNNTSVTDPTVFTVTGVDRVLKYTATVVTASNGSSVTSDSRDVLKIKWCNSVGHALVGSVEWELGGSRIDRHTGEHYDMWCEVSEPEEKKAGYSDMIGRYDEYDINYDATSSSASRLIFVPMRFSFNVNPGSALPLLALQFHDCRLNFEFRSFAELIKTNFNVAVDVSNELAMPSCKIFATYIFLSQEERMRFAQMPHEYLIEQLQAQVENVASVASGDGVQNRKITLTLNHPIKEIMFVYHATTNITRNSVTGNNWFDYDIPGVEAEEIFEEANIQMNGHDRFVKRPAKYWRLVQPWSHHTRCPTKKVHCYSFALHPESWENPSGAANFSRIDAAHLSLKLNQNIAQGRIRIHAMGYNVLRIANGLSGIVFAS